MTGRDWPELPYRPFRIHDVAKLFHGLVHGDNAQGVWDISFPNIGEAVGFSEAASAAGWVSTLREPVKTFDESVVVQARRR